MKLSLAKFSIAFLFVLPFFASTTLAGPPLICHTFDIGNAKSLPWIGHNWNLTGAESYDTNRLPSDTLSILDSDPTVLVHMETLRRAALYGQKDPVALKQLLLKLIARSDAAANSTSPSAAIASFDLGYFAATLSQVHWIYRDFANPSQAIDAYSLIQKSLQLRPNDPQIQFAAALITLNGPIEQHKDHAKKAIAGAQSDPLLARNLSSHFMSPQSETMTNLITRDSNLKVAQQ